MTIKTPAEIVSEMLATLRVSDPELDTSVGSVTRKIIDVVGEQIGPAYAESYLYEYVFSVDVKTGADLDDFCAMFGLYRLPAKRAVGVVEFSRPTVATANIVIPKGVQVTTGTTPRVVFQTVAAAIMAKGTKTVSVPVQAVVAGSSGNLPAGSLTLLATGVPGVSAAAGQGDAATGGTDAESDPALIARFKKTVFRSLAGTEDMFLGLALEDTTPEDATDEVATQANVIGSSKRWREQVQVVDNAGTLEAVSTIPAANAKFIFPSTLFFGQDIDNGSILTEGIHFDFDTSTVPPKITGIGTNLEEDMVYDLDFEYVPTASRNDPTTGVMNRVDVWVSGVSAQQGSETTYWRPGTFSASPTDPLFADKFRRLDVVGDAIPDLGNKFLQLAWGPIIEFPDQLVVAGETYLMGTDYWVVHQDDGFGYSPDSKFGLEWLAANTPAVDDQIVLSGTNAYFYNKLPADVQARIRRWKLVTTDVKAHAAKQVRLRFNFALMYSASYERGVVQAEVESRLAQWTNSLGFRSVVQVSDILAIVHETPGVDNVRFLNDAEQADDTDANSWGIEVVTSDGTRITNLTTGTSPDRASDIVLAENEVPVFYAARFVTKAQNTYSEPGA